MKKCLLFIAAALAGLFTISDAYASSAPEDYAPKVDKSKQARILITTDLEVDDMNGLLLSLIYSDQYDLTGIVWTAGMFHFSGDGGQHTLGEITPNFRAQSTHCEHRVKGTADLTDLRPVDPTWLGRVLDYYEADYAKVSKNNPNYPTPEYLRSITKVGNIEFEGDYRFETEGSKLIYDRIMDDDPRPLIIQHWGGINTTVRALYSIYEKYHGTPQWDSVLKKVTDKVRISGNGEDNCRSDSKIDEMFPGLKNADRIGGFFNYGTFFSAGKDPQRAAAPELQPYMHAPWNLEAYKYNHGKLTGEIWLMAEGRAIYGEPLIYNFGLIDYIDWAQAAEQGWAAEGLKSFKRVDYEPFSWGFCQFGCASFINIGLRSDVQNRDNHYTAVMWEELAARADWAICYPSDCNHAPIVDGGQLDFTAAPGKKVNLAGSAKDPDGDRLITKWYSPTGAQVSATEGWKTTVTVPSDAKSGDKVVVNLEVRDDAERPMTRFAQYVITVK